MLANPEQDNAPDYFTNTKAALMAAVAGACVLWSWCSQGSRAIPALPPHAMFGMVVFSGRVGVYNLKGAVPHVEQISIATSSIGAGSPGAVAKGHCSVGVDDVVPIDAFLVPVR